MRPMGSASDEHLSMADKQNGVDGMIAHAARGDLVELTADIVSAYVANNTVAPAELAGLIHEVYQALDRAATHAPRPLDDEELKPVVPIKKSVTDEYIVCLEDGKKFKSLKRHLRTKYNMTPEAYREKWKLPPDYPMVAPNYAAARSALAKKMGLGQRRSGK